MPCAASCAASPTPESISRCGELIAPPHRITSARALAVLSVPCWRYSTPLARLPSNKMRVACACVCRSIRPFTQGRAEIGVGGGGSPASLRVDLENPQPFASTAIEIGRGRQAQRRARRDEAVAERMHLGGNIGHMLRPALAAPAGLSDVAVFGLDEEGQHIVPAPAHIACRAPIIKIMRLAAHMHHRIDRA